MPLLGSFGAASARGFGHNALVLPDPTYKEGFIGNIASGATATLTLTTPPSPYRWIIVSARNSNASTNTQYPSTIFVNNSTTYLGNTTNYKASNGVSSDGNASASSATDHTVCRIPTGTTVDVKFTNGRSDNEHYNVAIVLLPWLNLTFNDSAAGDAGAANDVFSINQVKGGLAVGSFSGSYGTWEAVTWSGLTKMPVKNFQGSNAVSSLAYNFSTTTAATNVSVAHTSTDGRVVVYSSWSPS
jgi:hypothetical protein